MTTVAIRRILAPVTAFAAVSLLPISATAQHNPVSDPRNDHLEPLTWDYASRSTFHPFSPETDRLASELYEKLYVVHSNVAEALYIGSLRNVRNEWVVSIHGTESTHGVGANVRREYSDHVVTCTVLDPSIASTRTLVRAPDGGAVIGFDDAKLRAIQVVRHDAEIAKDAAEGVRSAWLEAVRRARYLPETIDILDGYRMSFTAFDPLKYQRMSGTTYLSGFTPGLKMLDDVANKLYDYCTVPEGDRNAAAEEIRREANQAAAYIKEHDPFKP